MGRVVGLEHVVSADIIVSASTDCSARWLPVPCDLCCRKFHFQYYDVGELVLSRRGTHLRNARRVCLRSSEATSAIARVDGEKIRPSTGSEPMTAYSGNCFSCFITHSSSIPCSAVYKCGLSHVSPCTLEEAAIRYE